MVIRGLLILAKCCHVCCEMSAPSTVLAISHAFSLSCHSWCSSPLYRQTKPFECWRLWYLVLCTYPGIMVSTIIRGFFSSRSNSKKKNPFHSASATPPCSASPFYFIEKSVRRCICHALESFFGLSRQMNHGAALSELSSSHQRSPGCPGRSPSACRSRCFQ